jgi:hypothetical protein
VIAAAGTAAAVKLSKQDAQKIEQHTGLPPEQLEDEDLNQALQELNIQLTDEERKHLKLHLRTTDTFVLRRCQILLASECGKNATAIKPIASAKILVTNNSYLLQLIMAL